jgi:APA family basic amino acid/polyamine antiporter
MRTKPIDDVIAQSESDDSGGGRQLRRGLGPIDLMGIGIGIGIGIVIGTGIFTLTGIEARDHAGPAVTLSFVIGAVVAGFAALC